MRTIELRFLLSPSTRIRMAGSSPLFSPLLSSRRYESSVVDAEGWMVSVDVAAPAGVKPIASSTAAAPARKASAPHGRADAPLGHGRVAIPFVIGRRGPALNREGAPAPLAVARNSFQ